MAKGEKLRGVLGREATRAIREYLEDARRGDAHTHILLEMSKHSIKKLRRIRQAYDHLPNGNKFTDEKITGVINSTGVSHRTTVSEYKNFMLGMGLILRFRNKADQIIEGYYEKGLVPDMMETILSAPSRREGG